MYSVLVMLVRLAEQYVDFLRDPRGYAAAREAARSFWMCGRAFHPAIPQLPGHVLIASISA